MGRKKGFTLIEMLIYIVFLSAASVVAVTSLFTIVRAVAEIRLAQDINDSATAVLGRTMREIRDAYGIDAIQSAFGTNPGRLVLLTKDDMGNNVARDFFVENGAIKLKEDGVDQGSLISQNVTVDNLVFTNITTANSQGVKITMQISGVRGNLSKTGSYDATAILRGEY
ncbi:hypothetical protein AUJ44_01140 [Candidatus Nomurabacteria bacterium CG1_02_47_685]|nr:MAG: hypothetical protein AUJ44_01140 [Candidatus Nomurabacteria bacterium CG1_02_47_685]